MKEIVDWRTPGPRVPTQRFLQTRYANSMWRVSVAVLGEFARTALEIQAFRSQDVDFTNGTSFAFPGCA